MPVTLDQARTVRVHARLQSGAALPTWFPAPLDGILAAASRRRRLGDDYGATPPTPPRDLLEADPHGTRIPEVAAYRRHFKTEDLPLAKLSRGLNNQWVWAATCATCETAAQDTRWHHKRFRSLQAEQVADRLPANTDVGATKAWRIPTLITVTAGLHWTALGDPEAILDLLADIVSVGDGTARGEGHVLRWETLDDGPAHVDAARWQPDGHIARPYPARARAELGVPDADLVTVDAIRPPYWRPPASSDGGFHRPQRQVIAPWTARPG